jgi:hypothetical protein
MSPTIKDSEFVMKNPKPCAEEVKVGLRAIVVNEDPREHLDYIYVSIVSSIAVPR